MGLELAAGLGLDSCWGLASAVVELALEVDWQPLNIMATDMASTAHTAGATELVCSFIISGSSVF